MDYADGLKDVLIRKINKTEKNLYGLKLDYCRFVYGISYRSKVVYDQVLYQVRSVNLDSMTRSEQGEWSRPEVSAVRASEAGASDQSEVINLGRSWELYLG